MIDSPSHAIDLLGGVKAVASLIGRPITTVSSWSSRESIPVDVWSELIGAAQGKRVKGYTYEAMTLAHAKATAKPRATTPRRKAA